MVRKAKVAGSSYEGAADMEAGVTEQTTREIISAWNTLARSGLLGGSTGDVSLRIGRAETVWITPHIPFVEPVAVGDLLEITLEGRVRRRRARPSASALMHLGIYRRRPGVQAIVHSRAPFVTLLGVCEVPVPPVTLDSIPFTDLPRVSVGVTDKQEWPDRVSNALADGAVAALLLHGGMVTVGADLTQAVRRALALEETARVLVLSHLLHQVPSSLSPEEVETLRQVWY